MNQVIFVIMDIVGGQTTPLLLCTTRKQAEREFALFLSNTPLRPSDFVLYELGVFSRVEDTADASEVYRYLPHIAAHPRANYVCSGGEIEQDVAYYEQRRSTPSEQQQTA